MLWTDPNGVTHETVRLDSFSINTIRTQQDFARGVYQRLNEFVLEHKLDVKPFVLSPEDLPTPEVTPVCDEGNFLLASELDQEDRTVNCLACIAAGVKPLEKED